MPWRNDAAGWGRVSILLHWLAAALACGLFGSGLWMTDLPYTSRWYVTAPFVHKSCGLTLLAIMLVRLAWRVAGAVPDPLPSHSSLEQVAARVVHLCLYVMLFSTMISGYLISTADGRAVSVFGLFEVPAIVSGLPAQADIAARVHFLLAVSLIAFAGLHALAALKHHFVDRDRTLIRMIRSERPSAANQQGEQQ